MCLYPEILIVLYVLGIIEDHVLCPVFNQLLTTYNWLCTGAKKGQRRLSWKPHSRTLFAMHQAMPGNDLKTNFCSGSTLQQREISGLIY